MALVANLNVAITATTAKFQQGLRGAGKSLKAFSTTVSANVGAMTAAMTVGFSKLLGIFNDMRGQIDDLSKSARRIGITVAELQSLDRAAERSGVSIESLRNSLQRFNRRIGETAMNSSTVASEMEGLSEGVAEFGVNITAGGSATEKALKKVGLTAKQVQQLGMRQSLVLMADGFKDLDDQTERTAVAFQLFGREGVNMLTLFEQGSDGLNTLIDDFDKFGRKISDEEAQRLEAWNDQLDDFIMQLGQFKTELAIFFTQFGRPEPEEAAQNIAEVAQGIREMIVQIQEAVPLMEDLFNAMGVRFDSASVGIIGRLVDMNGELVELDKSWGEIVKKAQEESDANDVLLRQSEELGRQADALIELDKKLEKEMLERAEKRQKKAEEIVDKEIEAAERMRSITSPGLARRGSRESFTAINQAILSGQNLEAKQLAETQRQTRVLEEIRKQFDVQPVELSN